MKTFISKIVVAGILSIALVTVTSTVPRISQKYLSYSSAAVTPAGPGQEMLAGSYTTMLNTLYATSGR